MPALKEGTRKYPDDPEIWFNLAEMFIHLGESTYGTREDVWEALRRAVDLDPTFAPYVVHYAEFAVLMGERSLAEHAIERYEALTGKAEDVAHIDLALSILLGDSAQVEAGYGRARSTDPDILGIYLATFAGWHDRLDLDIRLREALSEIDDLNRNSPIARGYAAIGQLQRGAALAARPMSSEAERALWWAYASMTWDVPPPQDDDPGGRIGTDACDVPAFHPTCHLFVGVAATNWDRHDLHERAIARLRQETARLRPDDAEAADQLDAYADDVLGSGLWRRGDLEAGRERLEAHAAKGHQFFTNWEGDRARIELAWLELTVGRPLEALRHFRAEALQGWDRPMALYGAGVALDRLGRHEEARAYYARLAAVASEADEDVPRLREVRAALAREGGL